MKKSIKLAAKKVAVKKVAPKKANVKASITERNTKGKAYPVVKSSRTALSKMIKSSNGRCITTTHVDKDGNLRKMNGFVKKNPKEELGIITMWSKKDAGYRSVNTQTLVSVITKGTEYKAPMPKKSNPIV